MFSQICCKGGQKMPVEGQIVMTKLVQMKSLWWKCKGSLTAAFQVLHVGREGSWHGDASKDAHDGRENEHETDHDSGEVDRRDAVQDDEDVVVVQPGEAVVEAGREQEGQDLEVEVEGRPENNNNIDWEEANNT